MTPSIPEVQYADARARCGPCLHEARSTAQADLYPLEWNGRPAVLKDFNRRPALVRVLWAGRVCAREVRMLAHLREVAGVPQLLATAGPYAFIMTRLEAVRLPGKRLPPPASRYWTRARALLEALHARGIAHGDLRRKNLLIGADDTAFLIDFATAVRRDENGGFGPAAWLYRRCRRIDRVTYARIKLSYGNVPLSADENHWLREEPLYLKIGRFLKKKLYRLRKPKTWRKLTHKLTRAVRHRLHGVPPPKPPETK